MTRTSSVLCLLLLLTACTPLGNYGDTSASSSSRAPLTKTYKDEERGFSLTYPASWYLDTESTNRQLLGLDFVFYDESFTSREGFRIEEAGRYGILTPISKFDKNVVQSVSDIMIGGRPGREVITTSAINPKAAGVRHIFVQHGDYFLQFQTSGPLQEEGVIDSVTFTQ